MRIDPRIENDRQGAHLLFCWKKWLLPLWGSSTYWRVKGQHVGQLLKDTEKATQATSWLEADKRQRCKWVMIKEHFGRIWSLKKQLSLLDYKRNAGL